MSLRMEVCVYLYQFCTHTHTHSCFLNILVAKITYLLAVKAVFEHDKIAYINTRMQTYSVLLLLQFFQDISKVLISYIEWSLAL